MANPPSFDPSRARLAGIAAGIGLVAALLFFHGLWRAANPVFDETHYLPAARALIALSRPTNIEHPLLGKELIAAGILMFGEGPLGWRFFSVLSGIAAVLAVFAIGWQLFHRIRPALVAALLAMFNFTLFIEARIGMLDGPMAALVLMALAAMLWAMRARRGAAVLLVLVGGLFGLAAAAKWAAIPYLAMAAMALVITRLRDSRWQWRSAIGGSGQPHFAGVATPTALILLAVPSLITYFLTFVPAFYYASDPMTLAKLVPFQAQMFLEQTKPLASHPYQSPWWSWPLDIRPIWYLYEPVAGVQRGILMLGNPIIMWGGLVALGYGLAVGLRERSWSLLAPVLLWTAAYVPWIIIPKKIGFFYYYYLPSILICLAIAAATESLESKRPCGWPVWSVVAAGVMFAYFYPIISASALDGPDAFAQWMWLPSWP